MLTKENFTLEHVMELKKNRIVDSFIQDTTFDAIIDEMICNAWYSVREYHIHLSGLQELYRPGNSREEFYRILEKNMQPVYDSARRQGYEIWNY